MAIVNGSLELGYKNLAWFTANPTLVLKEGQIVYLEQTGTFKIGNGVSTLSALSFLGVSSETQTLQNVTDLGATTTNSITANGFVKTGGTASQFLKANGSVDSSTYASTTYVDNQDALKVDKVVGKGLSTNDYTTAEQTKLAGIATGAEVNVNADWNATSGDAQILNKPTIPTQVVPVGGTTGQILAKVDDTDYNLEWIENYANYTSTLKHTVKASVALTKGQAVYVSGASGTNMLVSKASNVSESTSSKTLGLVAQDLAINGQGFVITEGLLSNLNTNSATIGDAVWLGVDGALIYGLASKPYAPAHLVFIGIVTRVSATVGEIFVKVQNGFELREIHDVDLITTTPSNNEILTYESSTGLWKNKSVISALGFTPYNSTNPSNYISGITSGMVTTALGFTPYNSTNPSGYITGITSGDVTTALGFTPYNATNPSGYITSSALTGLVPYTGATANVDLGTRTLTTPTINGVSGLLSFKTTDRVSVGNYATPSAQRIFTVGQDTAFITIGSLSSSTTYSAIYFNAAIPSGANFALMGNNGLTQLGTTNQISFSRSGTTFMQTDFGMRVTWNMTSNSFGYTPFNYIKNAVTGGTASTALPGWNYTGGSTQWATGNITTQSENVWGATTYSFVGASTITNAFGNVFNAPVAGTNCTISNNWAAQFNAGIELNTSNKGLVITTSVASAGVLRQGLSGGYTFSIDGANGNGPRIGLGSTPSSGYDFFEIGAFASSNNFATKDRNFRITSTISSVNDARFVIFANTGNLKLQNGGTFTDDGFRLDVNGTGRFQNTLTLATGTTSIAPLKLIAGTNLTTPVNGSFEFDGTNLYFTVGGVRKIVTLL
jgi:hypothetical protein